MNTARSGISRVSFGHAMSASFAGSAARSYAYAGALQIRAGAPDRQACRQAGGRAGWNLAYVYNMPPRVQVTRGRVALRRLASSFAVLHSGRLLAVVFGLKPEVARDLSQGFAGKRATRMSTRRRRFVPPLVRMRDDEPVLRNGRDGDCDALFFFFFDVFAVQRARRSCWFRMSSECAPSDQRLQLRPWESRSSTIRQPDKCRSLCARKRHRLALDGAAPSSTIYMALA